MSDVPTIIEIAHTVCEALGKPQLSEMWLSTLRAFYGMPLSEGDVERLGRASRRSRRGLAKRFRELWVRIGRRGLKSFVAALIAVYEMVWGGHGQHLIAGELGLVAILSKDVAGSTVVARFAKLILECLGYVVSSTRMGAVQVLQVDGFPLGIACLACTSDAPRGYPIPVCILDEFAFVNADLQSDDADVAILGAIKPAMLQFPNSKLIVISSPLGKMGLHYDTIEAALGNDDEGRILAVVGPTWEWNTTLTEAELRVEIRDPSVFDQEIAAHPRDVGANEFFGSALEPSVDAGRSGMLTALAAGTPSYPTFDLGVTRDKCGYALSVHEAGDWDAESQKRGPSIVRVLDVGAWPPEPKPRDSALKLKNEVLMRYRSNHVFIDQYSGAAFADICEGIGVRATVVPWTPGNRDDRNDPDYQRGWGDPLPSASKTARFRMVKLAMLDGRFRIPDDPVLIRELRSVRLRLTSAGNEIIELPRTSDGHCDRTAAMVMSGSIALMNRPCLAPSRETWFEARARRQREAEERNILDRISMWI